MKLIVGAGERHEKGYVHHDVQDLPGIDIVCEFWGLPKHVKPGTCSEIKMTHVLEHFPMKDTLAVLRLLHSLLELGGKLYIEVPNFYWHALEIATDPTNRQIVEYAFGGQLNEWDFHYNGFTPEILKEDLENAGFKVVDLAPNSSIECWAEKQ
jgi:hypothetical protein